MYKNHGMYIKRLQLHDLTVLSFMQN